MKKLVCSAFLLIGIGIYGDDAAQSLKPDGSIQITHWYKKDLNHSRQMPDAFVTSETTGDQGTEISQEYVVEHYLEDGKNIVQNLNDACKDKTKSFVTVASGNIAAKASCDFKATQPDSGGSRVSS